MKLNLSTQLFVILILSSKVSAGEESYIFIKRRIIRFQSSIAVLTGAQGDIKGLSMFLLSLQNTDYLRCTTGINKI